MLELLVVNLKQLRQLATAHGDEFHSDGFQRFVMMVADELDDE